MTEPMQIQVGRVQPSVDAPAKPSGAVQPVHGASFTETLEQVQSVRFSNHALKRLQSREITLNSDNVNRLSNAIDKAEKRGGKSSLVMVDDLAFIVNVHNRTVVTALDTNQRGEGVFTQIDSVVFADPAQATSSIDIKG